MIKNIVKDVSFLSQPSTDAGLSDLYIANDLKDTLKLNRAGCVGMAANMIGYLKNIIIFEDEKKNYVIMIYGRC